MDKPKKIYDYEKALALINENKNELESARLGMSEDWFWTGETVWEGGEFKENLSDHPLIAGINGSIWATPTVELRFKNGDEQTIPCFVLGEMTTPEREG